MQRHLRHHLERLALFSLPAVEDEDGDDEKGASISAESHQVIQGRGRRDFIEQDFGEEDDIEEDRSDPHGDADAPEPASLETIQQQFSPKTGEGHEYSRQGNLMDQWIEVLEPGNQNRDDDVANPDDTPPADAATSANAAINVTKPQASHTTRHQVYCPVRYCEHIEGGSLAHKCGDIDAFARHLRTHATSNPSVGHLGGESAALLWAAVYGYKDVAELFLNNKADIKSRDQSFGQTPLSWAAERGHEGVVVLLDKGADIETRDQVGRTPLLWAAENGHEGVVVLLLDKGADIETRDQIGQTPLSWAAENGHEGVVELLLDKGADIETRNQVGRTPLSRAAGDGQEAMVKLLLRRGADIESKDNQGWTPLILAAKKGYKAVVKLLEDGA
ncbi:ankyrin repeat-containing domain protein [Immersiella caudata]|uniref:Ankyrin repeat-containing domain protein n=1 Tax=Immersiella caudata TaxID=314043 RepID=A0AA39WY84_9PEZI|nr:ankyrin repeat-containing domain protein [Immersiella caudata]